MQAVFIPDHILAFLACHLDVGSAVPIRVSQADIVHQLVLMNPMLPEPACAVIFKWCQNTRALGAPHKIGPPIAVDVAGRPAVRSDVARVDFVRLPIRRFEPHLMKSSVVLAPVILNAVEPPLMLRGAVIVDHAAPN